MDGGELRVPAVLPGTRVEEPGAGRRIERRRRLAGVLAQELEHGAVAGGRLQVEHRLDVRRGGRVPAAHRRSRSPGARSRWRAGTRSGPWSSGTETSLRVARRAHVCDRHRAQGRVAACGRPRSNGQRRCPDGQNPRQGASVTISVPTMPASACPSTEHMTMYVPGVVQDEPERRGLARPCDDLEVRDALDHPVVDHRVVVAELQERPLPRRHGHVRRARTGRPSPRPRCVGRLASIARSAASTPPGEREADPRDDDQERPVPHQAQRPAAELRHVARAHVHARAGAASWSRRSRDDSAIAAAASAGLSVIPKAGYRTPIATGISSTL